MKKFILLILICLFATVAVHAQEGTAGSLNWSINSGVLNITGNGAIPDYDSDIIHFTPWYEWRNAITSIHIDEGVTAIGAYSFAFLEQIHSVFIPASVNFVHPQFVHECYSLTDISVDPANQNYTSHEGVLLDKFKTTVIACPPGKNGKYSIPVTVTGIAGASFHFNTLSSISIPASVTDIQPLAFSNSHSLNEIVNKSAIPQTVMSSVFEGVDLKNCTLRVPVASIASYREAEIWKQFGNIRSLTDPLTGNMGMISWTLDGDGVLTLSGVADIPEKFFSALAPFNSVMRNNIYSIVIEDGITGIGNAAFADSYQITSVSIPRSVTGIDASAFAYCTNLTSITIPSSVRTIQRFFLAGCTSLTSILVEEGNKDFVSVDGVLFNKDMTWLAAFPVGRPGRFSYVIPESVVYIGDDAFYECAGLTSVTIPTGVKSIGSCAFYACSSLTSVEIPYGVSDIYMRAFEDCVNLTSVFLPATVSFIGNSVFGNCRKLLEVVNAGRTPLSIHMDVFWGINLNNSKLMVPYGSLEDYKYFTVWKDFGEIMMLDPGLKLDKYEVYLLSGATTELTASLIAGLNPDEVEWYSSHTGIASVDNTGTVLAIKPGSVDIYAIAYGCTAFCMVTVIQPGNSSIEGTVNNAGTANVRVNLYMKVNFKRGIIGGYVLLATTVPNDDGTYSFEDLPEGSYQVEVEIDDIESEATVEIHLSEGETHSNIDFIVDEQSGTVAPRVLTRAEDIIDTAGIKIYPNPFTDIVRIAVETGRAQSLQMQVINVAGMIVHTQTIASPDEIIHLDHLPAGMYIIRLENGNMIKTLKAIKIQ